MDVDTGSCKHLQNRTVAWELTYGLRDDTQTKSRMEPLEVVSSVRVSGSYKRQWIRELERVSEKRDRSEVSERFERQTYLRRSSICELL
jgi:hypothetical protein